MSCQGQPCTNLKPDARVMELPTCQHTKTGGPRCSALSLINCYEASQYTGFHMYIYGYKINVTHAGACGYLERDRIICGRPERQWLTGGV
jgi:hypothetical protein